jgi:antitoxin ParD1/3/4
LKRSNEQPDFVRPLLTKIDNALKILIGIRTWKGKPMNVNLTPELEQMVRDKVRTGRYNSASEVVREALRLMEERDQVKADIRKKIAEGIESARAGRLTDGDAFFAQMEAELDEEIRAEEEKSARERAEVG